MDRFTPASRHWHPRIVQHLERTPMLNTAAEIAFALGCTPERMRFELRLLQEAGRVTRERAKPGSAWRWSLHPRSLPSLTAALSRIEWDHPDKAPAVSRSANGTRLFRFNVEAVIFAQTRGQAEERLQSANIYLDAARITGQAGQSCLPG